jgi:HisJ family histidinol phosphate phosphatase
MNWLVDTHTHSEHSFDGKHSVLEMAQTAEKMGLSYYAVTDHLEFEYEPWNHPFDPAAQRRDIEAVQQQVSLKLAYGAEIGLSSDPKHARMGWDHIKAFDPDVVIGSLHVIDGQDVYNAPYFVGKDRAQAYGIYLENILAAIKTLPEANILGHYDFVCKRAPFEPRAFALGDAFDIGTCTHNEIECTKNDALTCTRFTCHHREPLMEINIQVGDQSVVAYVKMGKHLFLFVVTLLNTILQFTVHDELQLLAGEWATKFFGLFQ